MAPSDRRLLAAAAVLAILAPLSGARQGFAPPEPFEEVDNIQGEFVTFLHPPVRPMAFDGLALYAINNHDSTVQRYTSAVSSLPTKTFRIPWTPVSIATTRTQALGGSLHLLVVCRGNEVLAVIEEATNRTVAVIPFLDADGRRLGEPGDILVDEEAGLAYVSRR